MKTIVQVCETLPFFLCRCCTRNFQRDKNINDREWKLEKTRWIQKRSETKNNMNLTYLNVEETDHEMENTSLATCKNCKEFSGDLTYTNTGLIQLIVNYRGRP